MCFHEATTTRNCHESKTLDYRFSMTPVYSQAILYNGVGTYVWPVL